VEGRKEEAEGERMSYTPKDTLILLCGLFVVAFASWLMVLLQSVEDALFSAHFVSLGMIFMLWFAIRKVEQKGDERERAGLRRGWKAEDFDEIDERIRKLEEEK